MISTGQKRQKRCQIPRSGWKRARRNRIPRTIRSKPLKIELRCGPSLVTRASRAEMTFFGSERLRRQHDASDDQQDRPKFQETEAGVFADQEEDSDGDNHQRAHQAANFAVGAVAYRLIWVAHFGCPQEFFFRRSQRMNPPIKINATGQVFRSHSCCNSPKFPSRIRTPMPMRMKAPIVLRVAPP